jgi:hypothetical protein
MNSIMVIHPYLARGVWVFDDPSTGLTKEPFVAGMPEIFRAMVGDRKKFTATFSAGRFPGYTHILDNLREDAGGNWYSLRGHLLQGWLCPALFKYFAKAPDHIYVRAG